MEYHKLGFIFVSGNLFTDSIPWDTSPFIKPTIWENMVGTFSNILLWHENPKPEHG